MYGSVLVADCGDLDIGLVCCGTDVQWEDDAWG